MCYARLQFFFAPLLICLIGVGCSRVGSLPASPITTSPPSPPAAVPGDIGSSFPQPGDLAEMMGIPRETSYMETDLIRNGKDYDSLLPSQNISISNDSARFETSWPGSGLEGTGYCLYSFYLGGYDRDSTMRYGWEDPPENLATVWIGLANWGTKQWDWWQGDDAGVITLAEIADYVHQPSAKLVVAVVAANAEVSNLRYLRIGPAQVTASFYTAPSSGVAPLLVGYIGSASSTTVGTIVDYSWDYDGDGQSDYLSALSDSSRQYITPGSYDPVLEVTTSYGESASTSRSIAVYDAWVHSWGTGLGETIYGAAYGSEFIYAAGSFGPSISPDGMVLKYNLAGDFIWAISLGGSGIDFLVDVAVDSMGNVILLGTTDSFGEGEFDFLIVKLSSDGTELWSRTWGTGSNDKASAVMVSGEEIFAVGYVNTDVGVIKFDPAGNLLWEKTWDGQYDQPEAAVIHKNFISQNTSIHITGRSSIIDDKADVLYLVVTEDGGLATQKVWGNPDFQSGLGISVFGFLSADVYIAGYNMDSGGAKDALFLEMGSSPGNLQKTWDVHETDEAFGVHRAPGDGFFLTGSTEYLSSPALFILTLSEAGAIEQSRRWHNAQTYMRLKGSKPLFSNAIMMYGGSNDATGIQESSIAGTIGNASGSWQDVSGSWNTPVAVLGTPQLIVENIEGGVVDTGGSGGDAAIWLHTIE